MKRKTIIKVELEGEKTNKQTNKKKERTDRKVKGKRRAAQRSIRVTPTCTFMYLPLVSLNSDHRAWKRGESSEGMREISFFKKKGGEKNELLVKYPAV